jgi:UDP-glucose 4-epimerase
MRVLVTGASGFVGWHVVDALLRAHDVVTLERRERPPDPRVRVARVDLETADTAAVKAAVAFATDGPIDAVVHLAARLDNPFGTDYTLTELAPLNVLGTMRLLEAASALGVRRFVYGSTGGVGTNPAAGTRMRESDPPGPVNPYGLTKHLAEQAVTAYRWPFERIALRYFAPYGRDGSNPMFRHLVDRISLGEPIDLPPDGGGWLNPIHVDDAATATLAALSAADPPPVVNVAGPDVVSMRELIGELGAALGRQPVISLVDATSLNWAADITLQSTVLGPPQIRLREGIRREFGPLPTPGR